MNDRIRSISSRQRSAAADDPAELYRAIFEESPTPMWLYDPDTLRFVDVNRAAIAHYGYSHPEFMHMTLKDIRPAEEIPRLMDFFRQRTYPKNSWGTWRHRRRDGRIIDVEVWGTTVAAGGRTLCLGVMHDVTESRRLQAQKLAESERLHLVMGQLPAYVWTTDRTPMYTSYEGATAQLWGFPDEEMIGRSVLVSANESTPIEEVLKRYQTALAGHTVKYEYVRNGRTFDCHLQPLFDLNGTVTGTIGIAIDVTERRNLDAILRRHEAVLAANQQLAHLGSWEFDPEADIQTWSRELYAIMGRSRTNAPLSGSAFWEQVHPDDVASVQRAYEETALTGKPLKIEHRIVRPDGTVRWLRCIGEASCDADGKFVRLFGSALDITERKVAEEQLAHLAMHDQLTRLPNRENAERFIAAEIKKAGPLGRSIAVLTLDIDRFKTINDGLGHAIGDQLLVAIPDRLRSCVRADDMIARLGGDTFIIVLSEIGGISDVTEIAGRLLAKANTPFVVGEHRLTITASIGISLYPTDGAAPDVLIESAESAMFEAKEAGRNRLQFCGAHQQAQASQRLALEQDLRLALERNELVLWYQPVVDFKTGAIAGAEALLRWQHPQRGLVSPIDFIPLAEETGLIVPIGDFVLRAATRQLASWQAQGFDELRLAVNVAKAQISNDDLIGSVQHVLEISGVAPATLALELTESGLMSDPHIVRRLEGLKKLGVFLALDDFGTGYSSLASLKRLPIDTLKIDRAFTRDLTSDASAHAIATTIITLGHSLNMSVIAEGVETRAQWERLRDLGCDAMQGFYYSRPMRAEDFTALLSSDRRHDIRPS